MGLRLILTWCGFIQLIVPQVLDLHIESSQLLLTNYVSSLKLWRDSTIVSYKIRITRTRRRSQFLLRRAKDGIINSVSPPTSQLLDLPGELREQIYQWACTPEPDGRLPGVQHLLLVNKQLYREAKPFFDAIEHTITIGDLERYKAGTVEFMGIPHILAIHDKIIDQPTDTFDWHIPSLRHLVLNLKICGIGTMTPDCFDVYIAHNGKEQWRNLKRLIGIWPELRETPLESVRLDLSLSEYDPCQKKYRADLIRVIRNFKRTKVWAEAADGDCSTRKGNRSVLLPLVKAFNQGRRNWESESDVENNLIVRYDEHILSTSAIDLDYLCDGETLEEVRQKWSVQPVEDTSRSDNSVWSEWTGKEERYIYEKMVRREREDNREWECRECLAIFDKPKELKAHKARGIWRK